MLGLLHHPPMPSLPGSFQRVAVGFSFLATLSVPHPGFGGVVGRGLSTVLEGLLRHNSQFVQPHAMTLDIYKLLAAAICLIPQIEVNHPSMLIYIPSNRWI